MPIQNVGTLLENIVVLEAARTLLQCTNGSRRPIDFASAFAMPPLSEWRGVDDYNYQRAFNQERLARLQHHSRAITGTTYGAILRPLLIEDPSRGPNGALLVAILASSKARHVRMWLNDLVDEHAFYPNAIAELLSLPATVGALLDCPPGLGLTASVCGQPYDACIADLAATLRAWHASEPPCARLGFLDPNRYTTNPRIGPQTSPSDHRRWLGHLRKRLAGPAAAVHFSGNRNTTQARAEIKSLHADGLGEGYRATRAFKRYHYVVSVNCFHSAGARETERVARTLERLVHEAWAHWHQLLATRGERLRPLITFENGERKPTPRNRQA